VVSFAFSPTAPAVCRRRHLFNLARVVVPMYPAETRHAPSKVISWCDRTFGLRIRDSTFTLCAKDCKKKSVTEKKAHTHRERERDKDTHSEGKKNHNHKQQQQHEGGEKNHSDRQRTHRHKKTLHYYNAPSQRSATARSAWHGSSTTTTTTRTISMSKRGIAGERRTPTDTVTTG
jgi:hypothetical protein